MRLNGAMKELMERDQNRDFETLKVFSQIFRHSGNITFGTCPHFNFAATSIQCRRYNTYNVHSFKCP